MAGYVKLYRGWEKSDFFSPNEEFCERAAWVWLVGNAAWKDCHRRNHKGETVEVKRGQVHVSLGSLETAFRWSRKRVRTFLARLEKCQMVGTNRAQSGTLLTICNYDKYQGNDECEGHSRGTAGAQPGHTQEEVKEIKEDKSSISPPQKRASKHLLPDDWQPSQFGDGSQSRIIVDGWRKDELATCLESFRAYHKAKATKHLDWQSAWSTWVLNSRRFTPSWQQKPQATVPL